MATANPQRIALGERLRVAREEAGIKTRDVEIHMDWHVGKASRVETGTRTLQRAEVEALAAFYGIPEAERATLHMLAADARKRESPSRVADFAQTYITLEERASEICYVDEVLIPSLLQTEGYAWALLRMSRSGDPAALVEGRLARQRVLHGPSAPKVRAILGEAALRRQVGGSTVLRDQLEHLLEIGASPNVEIRILPDAVGEYRTLGVGFTLLRLDQFSRVYIEGQTGATYLHEPADVDVYAEDFEEVWSVAPDGMESATILRRHIGVSEE